jgi:hypothetical protein
MNPEEQDPELCPSYFSDRDYIEDEALDKE